MRIERIKHFVLYCELPFLQHRGSSRPICFLKIWPPLYYMCIIIPLTSPCVLQLFQTKNAQDTTVLLYTCSKSYSFRFFYRRWHLTRLTTSSVSSSAEYFLFSPLQFETGTEEALSDITVTRCFVPWLVEHQDNQPYPKPNTYVYLNMEQARDLSIECHAFYHWMQLVENI